MADPIADQTLPTRAAAERTARLIGCTGAHETEGGWQPCESNEALMILIRRGVGAYRRHRDGQKSANRVVLSPEVQKFIDSQKRRKRKRKRRRWEDLGERGVTAIDGSGAGITGVRGGP